MRNSDLNFWNSLVKGLTIEENSGSWWRIPLVVFSLFIVLASI